MWKEIGESHGGRLLGVTVGTFFGILYLIVGLWDMLFFSLLIFIGYNVGKRWDLKLHSFFPWQRISVWISERWERLK